MLIRVFFPGVASTSSGSAGGISFGVAAMIPTDVGITRWVVGDAPWTQIPDAEDPAVNEFSVVILVSLDNGLTWDRYRRDEAYSELYVRALLIELEYK